MLRPAILWNDQRTGAECDAIRAAVGPERLIAITGNDALTGLHGAQARLGPRPRARGLARGSPTSCCPKDYVRLRLTGEYAIDKADGAGTLLFDLAARDWSPEVLAALGIDPAWLPPTFEGPEVTGVGHRGRRRRDRPATPARRSSPAAATRRPTPSASAPSRPGTMALSLGTSGVVFATTDRPLFEPRGRVHAFCHAVPGRWHMMSVMLSAAGSLRWFRDALAPGVAFGDLVAPAAEVPGRERRPVLPALPRPASAARTPIRSPAARSSASPSATTGAT